MEELAAEMICKLNDKSIEVNRRLKMIAWLESYLHDMVGKIVDETA